ncbi:Phox homologous domain-containing protein [Collybia nuda]|uniref:Phox homologous domain-containing protein n=1 Tax=Collybia nuda TaxID=64659 RepID=A0A9P6CHD9_9AGAR|nr:Phox homologous domain-containing protein [Collybia nuda]
MTAIQAVYIRGYEERSSPKPHTVYRIEIQAHVRSWQMWRRYSEFDDLHTDLVKSTGSPPPCPLPPKHKFSILRPRPDTQIRDERRAGLEVYLRTIIGAREDKWRESFAFKDFLGVPTSRQGGGPPSHFTSSSWLDEHLELQTRIRDVRADINKRDAFSDRGDIGDSHKANVSAKSKLAGIVSRIGALEKELEELGMHGISEGELQRRSDMVARLRDDHEKLTRMVTVAQQSSRTVNTNSLITSNVVPNSDREALLGTNVFKPITRVFGGVQPRETEQTRPLDDQGLVGLQQAQIQQQDEQLSQLTTVLQRQKQLGQAIGSEIAYQIEMLDSLSNDVDRVGGKLTTTNRQLNRLG